MCVRHVHWLGRPAESWWSWKLDCCSAGYPPHTRKHSTLSPKPSPLCWKPEYKSAQTSHPKLSSIINKPSEGTLSSLGTLSSSRTLPSLLTPPSLPTRIAGMKLRPNKWRSHTIPLPFRIAPPPILTTHLHRSRSPLVNVATCR